MSSRRPWPFPGDTPTDRARRIAQSYRAELMLVAPEVAERVDARAVLFGEHWVTGRLATTDMDTMLPARPMAELVGEEGPDVIRQWATRGKIPRYRDGDGRTVYRVGDVVDHQAEQRRRRAQRARGKD